MAKMLVEEKILKESPLLFTRGGRRLLLRGERRHLASGERRSLSEDQSQGQKAKFGLEVA